MTYSKEDQFRRREQDLKERELEVRLRELEHEIEKTTTKRSEEDGEPAQPVEVLTDDPPAKRKQKAWVQNIINFGKFFALMVVGLAAFRLAAWVAMAIIIGAIGFLGYLFFIKK